MNEQEFKRLVVSLDATVTRLEKRIRRRWWFDFFFTLAVSIGWFWVGRWMGHK